MAAATALAAAAGRATATSAQATTWATGFYLDVSGNSCSAGANMDTWYWNGNLNQLFWVD